MKKKKKKPERKSTFKEVRGVDLTSSPGQSSYVFARNQSLFVGMHLILFLAHKGCTFKLAFSPVTTMQISVR